jgi:beta-N-acetylglucosaminidase
MITNISNAPIELELATKKYKVQRLNLLEIYHTFESEVKSQYMADVITMASLIKDPKERISVQSQAIKEMPKGKEIEEQVNSKISSFDGAKKMLYIALNKNNSISEKEIDTIIADSKNTEQIKAIMDYICGADIEEPKDEIPEGAVKIEIDDEKKV